jgi:hypothetical protein
LDEASPLSDGQCVLYLGQADGVWALFDPATQQILRIPTAALAV